MFHNFIDDTIIGSTMKLKKGARKKTLVRHVVFRPQSLSLSHYSAFGASVAGTSVAGVSVTGASAAVVSAAFFLPPRRVVLVVFAAFLPFV